MTGPLLTPDVSAHLLERMIFLRLVDSVDFESLDMLEEDIAIALDPDGSLDDEQTLALSRALIGRALRELARQREHGTSGAQG